MVFCGLMTTWVDEFDKKKTVLLICVSEVLFMKLSQRI